MSVWKRISSLPEYHLCMKRYYDEKGLVDLREYLALWLEERIMSDRYSSGEHFESIATQFYEDLTQKIVTLSNDNHVKYKLEEICKHISQVRPIDLYAYLRNGIQTELQLLKDMPQNPYGVFGGGNVSMDLLSGASGGNGVLNGSGIGMNGGFGGGLVPGAVDTPMEGMVGMAGVAGIGPGVGGGLPNMVGGQVPQGQFGVGGHPAAGNGAAGLVLGNGQPPMMHTEELYAPKERLRNLMLALQGFQLSMMNLGGEYEKLTECYSHFNRNVGNMPLEDSTAHNRNLSSRVALLISQKAEHVSELRNLVRENEAIQNCVTLVLNNWRRNQALAGNGASCANNLDDIQFCIEQLVDVAARLLVCGDGLSKIMPGEDPELNTLMTHVRSTRAELVCSAFIVDRQPPQVMKTNTRFAAAVRWLIGPQLGIGSDRNTPQVECIILSEAQAQRHFAKRNHYEEQGSTSIPQSSGDLSNCTANMEYQQATRVFSASFRNMQLKKIKRAEKKGTESVMDEKFALLFLTTVNVSDYRIRVWTLSLPVVVIVHGNQEPQSWATITWDNAFADIVREPFQVPDKVCWSQLSMALNTKFTSTTGRPLTEENLSFLYEKLFRHDYVPDDQKDYISWTQFCKEPLPDRTFTFWEWFFAIMKLTKDHLLNLWKAGLIIGFISKNKTIEQTLANAQVGTFILRFSDSESGGITVAFVDPSKQVLMLTPWTARDLTVLSLADRIRDLQCLSYLYPYNKMKDDAFGEFYSHRLDEPTTTTNGYVASSIKATVPMIEAHSLSVTNTPQHQMQSPNSLGNNLYDDDGIEMYWSETNVADFMPLESKTTPENPL